MSKIWKLYTEARMSGKASDITAYEEAVASLPVEDFLTEAEYIIRSSVGLKHFRELSEKYGLSIPFATRCETILEESIDKCKEQNQDSSAFDEALSYLKDRREKYQPLYDMYEWYSLGDEDQYLETYYGTTKGKYNRLYPERMIMFGEEAIPDLIITANEKDNLQKLLEYYENEWTSNDGIFCEWMMRGLSRIADTHLVCPYIENACSTKVHRFKDRKQQAYRESVLTHQDLAPVMTKDERIAIDEQIRFLEFGLTSPSLDVNQALDISKEIYSLYEDTEEPSTIEPSNDLDGESEFRPVFVILKSYFRNDEDDVAKEKYAGEEDKIVKDPYPILNKISGGDQYGHAIVSFDLDMKKSFEVFRWGLVRTQIDETWKGTKNLYFNVLFVKKEAWKKMIDVCEEMVRTPNSVRYSFSYYVKAYLGKPTKARNHVVCSGFVGYLLGLADPKNLQIDYSRMRPEDLTLLPRCFHFCDVTNIDEYFKQLPELRTKLNDILNRHEEEIEEYNNELPRLMLKERMDKATTFDNFFDSIGEIFGKVREEKEKRGLLPEQMTAANNEEEEPEGSNEEDEEEKELAEYCIFREAGDDMGIMYDSYSPLGKVLISFITPLRRLISSFNKEPTKVEVDLEEQIKAFKDKINIKATPKEIDIRKISQHKQKVANFQRTIENCIKAYAACKNDMSYGGNLWRGIIKRPKVMTKNIDSEEYNKINSGIRQINRALDWFEKAIIDLSNLASQDMNILRLVDRVYRRQNIYEATVPRFDIDKHLPDSGLAADFITRNIGDPGSVVNHPTHSTHLRKSQVPTYLRNAHSIADWGEEDDDSGEESLKRKEEREDDIEDLKRPSANDSKPQSTSPDDTNPPPAPNPEVPKPTGGATNYYYYNFTNSLNKNQGSYNKTTDNSTDRSTHNIDRSTHTRDDHSSNINNSKTNNSRVNTVTDARATQTGSNYINSDKSKPDDKTPSKFHQLESTHMPWELRHYFEDVGDADKDKPQSDHPIKDTLMDIDRATVKYQQGAKKAVQDVQNVGRAAAKPVKRTGQWLKKVISDWRDKDETAIKEKMADPHARDGLFGAIKTSIKYGALWQAGLLLNPIWLFLAARGKYQKFKNRDRIRNEVVHELRTEIGIIDSKIHDAEAAKDMKAKYQLMRFKGEIEKKLARVGGGRGMEKLI